MDKKAKRVLLLVVSILMIVTGPFLAFFSFSTIYHYDVAAPYPNSDLGGVIAAILYVLSIVLGIIGIVHFRKKSGKVCRVGGWIVLAAGIVNLYFLSGNFIIEFPLILFLILYLAGAKKKKDITAAEENN